MAYLPPAVWVVIWVAINITLALYNKFCFSETVGFDFPVFLSAIHMFCIAILSHVAIFFKMIPVSNYPAVEEEKVSNTLFWFSGLYILNIAFGNISLKIVNMAMSQVVRATIPFAAIILSYFILKQKTAWSIVASVVPVVIGVGLTVLHNVDYSPLSLAVLCIGIFLAAFKTVMTNKYLKTYKTMHPVEFLSRITPLSCCYLVLLSTLTGESQKLIQKQWNGELTLFSWGSAFGTGITAFALNWTNFIANRSTTALTMTVAGNIKQLMSVLLSIVLFNTHLEWWNMVGVIVAFCGLAIYSYMKHQARVAAQEKKAQQEGRV